MTPYVLRAGTVAVPHGLWEDGFVALDGRSITAVGQGQPPSGLGAVVDLGDMLLAPGFIDVHVHGGGGAQVNCATTDQVEQSVSEMAIFHAGHGTTALLATTVSDSPGALRAAVTGILAATRRPLSGDEPPRGATVLGSHLEGPWISPARRGAQFPGAIRPPSARELSQLLDLAKGTVRLVTIAPELDGAADLIALARAAGAVISIGHTEADFETAAAAFEAGARHATHLFNAMAPIHHRRPGPVAAALRDHRVTLEVIADGVHIHPALIALVARLAPERLVLVTDAIGATGTREGLHRLGPVEVLVSDGRAVLAGQEETVAGSVLTMDKAVAYTVKEAGVALVTALQAASLHPARALGQVNKGRLAVGADADLVALAPDLSLAATVIAGHPVHDPGGLLSAIAGAGAARRAI